mmetsp:Transcript_64095/g.184194  ORF Transcript_64095/g.184194 Transcript_64095/m.184194 type:complete len:219 (+) Transcript_64095:1057-1713(+)
MTRDHLTVCNGDPVRSLAAPSYVVAGHGDSSSISAAFRFVPACLPPACLPPFADALAAAARWAATVRAEPDEEDDAAGAAPFFPLAAALALAFAAAAFAFAFATSCLPMPVEGARMTFDAAVADLVPRVDPSFSVPRTVKSMRRSTRSAFLPLLSKPLASQSVRNSVGGNNAKRSRFIDSPLAAAPRRPPPPPPPLLEALPSPPPPLSRSWTSRRMPQ